MPLPSHQGSAENCSIKNTFTVCPLPAEGGHVHLIATLTQARWRVAGLLSTQTQASGLKKKQEKRDADVRSNLNTGCESPSLPGLT